MINKDYDSVRKYLFDANNNRTLLLKNDKMQVVRFEQVFVTERCKKLYCILHPLIHIEGFNSQSALVFVVGRDGVFRACNDKKRSDKVFAEYYSALQISQKEK